MSAVLDSPQDASDFAKTLLRVADNCQSNLALQQYVFSRVEEVLGLGSDLTDADSEAFGSKHATLFTKSGKVLHDGSFLKALSSPDSYLQQSASAGLACLLTVCDGDLDALLSFIIKKLNALSTSALSPLTMVVKVEKARQAFVALEGVGSLIHLLQKVGTNGNAQVLYEISFVLWTLSLDAVADQSIIHSFLSAGTIPSLVEVVAAAPSRKSLRMSIGALKNLALAQNDTALTELLSGNLLKLLDQMILNTTFHSNDPELENDSKVLFDILNRNFRDLSTFDRWVSQVHSGALR